jgi:hypothetical protein
MLSSERVPPAASVAAAGGGGLLPGLGAGGGAGGLWSAPEGAEGACGAASAWAQSLDFELTFWTIPMLLRDPDRVYVGRGARRAGGRRRAATLPGARAPRPTRAVLGGGVWCGGRERCGFLPENGRTPFPCVLALLLPHISAPNTW